MAKKKSRKSEVTVSGRVFEMADILRRVSEKDYEIIGADLKDDFCTFEFKIVDGHMKDEQGKHKGPLIISDDLKNAFNKLRIHLAVIDDAFNLSMVEIDSLEAERNHELVQNYEVSGFKIKGADENIQVSLIGSKYLTAVSGRMSCATPNVLLTAGGGYKWYNELLEDIQACQLEVAYYKEGKGMRPDAGGEKEDPNQLTITSQIEEEEEAE